ncbi:MAG TPA: hypothetical protein VEX35_04475 [Allosphingosinicella sp.]|nr:hypothetical protein [Allosphingosinicella sp.]
MASAPPPQAKVDVGRVIGRGFEALKSNFLGFFATALLLAGLPAFLTQYLVLSAIEPMDPAFVFSPVFWGGAAGGIFVTVFAGALLQGVLVRSTILHLSGRDVDLGASVLFGLRLILPIIGVTICVGVLVTLGLVLLIFPGVMIYCALIVSIPALVEERRGVFGSIGRSRELTRGSRWQVFLLLVLFWIFSSIISAILGAVTGVTMGISSLGTPVMPDPILAGTVSALTGSLTAVIVAVVLAALYVELREVKEGATPGDLADVFA